MESVDAVGLRALIILADGYSAFAFTYLLKDGEVPFGSVIDLAMDFLNHIKRN